MTSRERPLAVHLDLDTEGLGESLAQARAAFDRDLAEPLSRSASLLGESLSRALSRLEGAVAKAARTGEFSVRAMVNAMLADLSRLAFERLVTKPLFGFVEQAIGGFFPFLGGRAIGGPVMAGGAYLVGERGPELFVPGQSGHIAAAGRRAPAPVHIHLHTPDIATLRRSEGQVTAMLARAVQRGARNL